MMYVYRKAASVGARELANAIEARRYRGNQHPIEERVRRGDVVICWGERLNPIEGVQILNGTPLANKFDDAVKLTAAGVPTVEVSRIRPQDTPVVTADPALPLFLAAQESIHDLGEVEFSRSAVFQQGVTGLLTQLQRLNLSLATPLPPPVLRAAEGWLPRLNNHVGGNDLLAPPPVPDYFSKKVELVKEFRIHSFLNKSIRAGVKMVREGSPTPPHAWIRSWDGGWKISYDGITSKQRHREVAHAAVTALNLQFGAVDIGEKGDGSLMVLEVNRAPGLEGGTIEAYAKAIEGWQEGGA